MAFLLVPGKAWGVGLLLQPQGQPLCAAHRTLGVPPHSPHPPHTGRPSPGGSAGVYRKCRTRPGRGWRRVEDVSGAWWPGVALRAGTPLPTPRTGFLLLLKGKVPLPRQPCLFPPGQPHPAGLQCPKPPTSPPQGGSWEHEAAPHDRDVPLVLPWTEVSPPVSWVTCCCPNQYTAECRAQL